MTIKGITIGGMHSWDDLGTVLTDLVIGAPEVQTSYVEVPGRTGDLDLTEALIGRAVYRNRTIQMTVQTTKSLSGEKWPTVYENYLSLCHGNKVTIIPDDDTDYYYVGRGQITAHTINGRLQTISASFNCEPYKYKADITTVAKDLTEDYVTITLYNDHMPVVPEIATDTDCYLIWNDTTYAISAGTWTSLDIELQDGDNIIQACTASGTGTIVFTWQEGRL